MKLPLPTPGPHVVLAFAAFLLCSSPWFTASASEEKRHLSFSTFPASGMVAVMTEVVTEAYRRLGITIDVSHLPAQRALQLADSGDYDGELGRLSAIEKSTSSLVRVPTPILEMRAFVYSIKQDFRVAGYESLRPFSVGILRGYKHAERMVADMDHVTVSEYDQLIRMLQLGRIDVFILSEFDALEAIRKSGASGIRALNPPINTAPMYHYVHARHVDLVEPLTRVLDRMHEENYIEEATSRYLRALQ